MAIGVAAFVASMGLAATLDAEVNATFDDLRATRLTVQDTRSIPVDPLFDVRTLDNTVAELPGVVAGGTMTDLASAQVSASTTGSPVDVGVVVASRGALDAALVTIADGRLYDSATDRAGTPVALVGAGAAELLGLVDAEPGQMLTIDERSVALAGVLDSPGSESQLSHSIMLSPASASMLDYQLPQELSALVRTESGAAASVASALPLAIRPAEPTAVGVSRPPEPESLRSGVQGSLDIMGLGLAALSLLVGGLGIMNAMVTAVSQRRGEIGLRRALGARPGHIVTLIVAEGSIIGLLGAVIGTATGLSAMIVVGLVSPWAPVLAQWVWLAAPGIGLALGALAGIYPARTSARLSPAEALRQ
ncbi:ABC transporter permease [Ruania alkalisoli]|uniref:ABC transporter permease n=1 Tax=Ruania alkalisoli TaxID=2779775 RepID=A0A7M1SR81_9MICO|nr:ABC transporter permease [Ruania alkalisoli]